MRFDRQEREAADAEPQGEPEPAPAEPHALLALQRSAGNAAVGRMLQRKFYAEGADGTYTWHPEALDAGQWEDTGKTTRWLMWTYPVYRPKPKAPEGGGEGTEKAKRRRPRKRKGPKTAPQDAAATPELVEDDVEAVEDETEAAGPEETPPAVVQAVDDGDEWTDVRSRGAVRAEREMARDVGALAAVIDAHQGDPADISTTFNQLFNARVRQGLEVEGAITSAYTTRFDRGRGGYSIEVTIPGLANWVIHAHLDANGALAPGENAIHYKRLVDQFVLGVSIALSPRQIDGLLPDEATRAGRRTSVRRGNL